ncbi:hypothetical protein [Fimbriiglobus ruber]|nr:hypothetical protein [Fimbriiglobus ruber]
MSTKFWARTVVVVLGLAFTLTANLRAEDETPAIRVVREEVAAKNIEKTRVLGSALGREPIDQVSKDGYIVGFDFGVGQDGSQKPLLYGIKPVHMTKHGAMVERAFGAFELPRNRGPKIQTVTVMAKKGYAVSGLVLRTAHTLTAAKVKFSKVEVDHLDMEDTYESEWLGNQGIGGKSEISTDGQLAVGISAFAENGQCIALGLIHLSDGKPEAARRRAIK